LKSPCLIVVGEVVALHETLKWFHGATMCAEHAAQKAESIG